jgi:phage protein D
MHIPPNQPHNSNIRLTPPLEFSKETLDMMKSLIANTEAYLKQEAAFRKEEEEEAYQEESSSIYDHSYSSPHQQHQEEPPSPKRSALEEAMARLERTMLAFLSEAKENRQKFARINNSITQSYEKMDAHFKQMMDIPQRRKVSRSVGGRS